MRVVKPNQLSLLSRPFDFNNKYGLCVGGLVLFPFSEPRYPMTESALWTLVGKELGETVLDECMPKLHGELLMRANAYAPGGNPHGVVRVAVELEGKLLKELAVVGDRVWKDSVPTDPEPFLMKSVTWDRAFGGEGFKQNPGGRGYRGKTGSPLPNIEDPKKLVTSPRQEPDPVGLGPYELIWPQRLDKAGKYDKEWFEKFYPGLAQNIDWTFFNVAPKDQQIEGFFRGDEELVLRNLHPEKAELRFKLPGVKLRCFMRRKRASGGLADTEIEMKLDTVWLIPHAGHGVLVFHGTAPIREDDASDVDILYLACEDLGSPKPTAHYEKELVRRLSDEHGALAALDDAPLMPALREGMKGMPSPANELAEQVATENLGYQNGMRAASRKIENARALLVTYGLDPDAHGPPPMEPFDTSASVEEMIKRVDEGEKKAREGELKMRAALAEQEARLAVLCAAHGLDFSEIKKEWKDPPPGGPPSPKSEGILDRMRQLREDGLEAGFDVSEIDGYLADPAFLEQGRARDGAELEGYRTNAQDRQQANKLGEVESSRLRQEILAAYARGESLAGRDLTGASLAGIELPGVDLEGALLECCDLTGANLSGARLSKIVLVRACLKGARFDRSDMLRANLSLADCTETSFANANLNEAILIGTAFLSTALDGVTLDNAILSDAKLVRCSLRGLRGNLLSLDGLDLTGTSFAKASLREATLTRCVLDGADFTEAELQDLTLYACRGAGVVFARSSAQSMRVVEGSELVDCDFRGANLDGACLRLTKFMRCDFSGAHAVGVDFSESNLTDAKLYHLYARQSRFVRTDLTRANLVGADLFEAMLTNANVTGTDLRGANLYQSDLAMVHGTDKVDYSGAMMVRARIKPLHSDKAQDLD